MSPCGEVIVSFEELTFFKLPLKEPVFNESSMFTLKMQKKDLFKGELLAGHLVGYGEMHGGKDGKFLNHYCGAKLLDATFTFL